MVSKTVVTDTSSCRLLNVWKSGNNGINHEEKRINTGGHAEVPAAGQLDEDGVEKWDRLLFDQRPTVDKKVSTLESSAVLASVCFNSSCVPRACRVCASSLLRSSLCLYLPLNFSSSACKSVFSGPLPPYHFSYRSFSSSLFLGPPVPWVVRVSKRGDPETPAGTI